jgi:hypothetical protein
VEKKSGRKKYVRERGMEEAHKNRKELSHILHMPAE